MGARVLNGSGYVITQGYSSSHKGTDIVYTEEKGKYITAHSYGTISIVQTGKSNSLGSTGTESYGNYVKILHPNGYSTLYAHLDDVYVSVGDSVSAYGRIGTMGNTGNSTGMHLHFEVRNTSDTRINSENYIENALPNSDSFSEVSSSSSAKIDISELSIVSVQGSESSMKSGLLSSTSVLSEGCEILFENDEAVYMPVVCEDITLEFSRSFTASVLKCTCVVDSNLLITEGNAVSFKYNGQKMFYGYVFEKSESDPYKITVTCYDQLRYFKNKTTYIYANKKYSEVLTALCTANSLNIGEIEDTEYIIESRIEECSLFDILGNASDETLSKTAKTYVLYDDFGSICLKNIDNMFVPVMIDEESFGSYNYTSSIDDDVYTKVTIAQDDDYTGKRELYIANNEEAQSAWGILEYYERYSGMDSASLSEMASTMLSELSVKKNKLTISDCLGDYRVRGGSSLMVSLTLNDRVINDFMLVENVEHKWSNGYHSMDLVLSGLRGEFTI